MKTKLIVLLACFTACVIFSEGLVEASPKDYPMKVYQKKNNRQFKHGMKSLDMSKGKWINLTRHPKKIRSDKATFFLGGRHFGWGAFTMKKFDRKLYKGYRPFNYFRVPLF